MKDNIDKFDRYVNKNKKQQERIKKYQNNDTVKQDLNNYSTLKPYTDQATHIDNTIRIDKELIKQLHGIKQETKIYTQTKITDFFNIKL